MATINITVQSLLNTAVYDSYTVNDAGTIGELKDSIETTTGCSIDWFDLVFDNEVLNTANTIASYGIVEDSKLRTHNKIARLANRELRQKAKLDLAALDRAASDNPRSTYDITELPTQYDGNNIVDNPNSDGEGGILLVEGRPWTDTPAPTYIVRLKSWDSIANEPGSVITTCNEGDTIYIEVQWANLTVVGGEDSYLVVGGVNIANADFNTYGPFNALDPIPWGSDNPAGPSGSTGSPLEVVADHTTEGTETVTWKWYVNGSVVASTSATVVDTSLDPTYTFSSIPTSIDEGSAGTFNVTTTSVDDGTTLYWTVETNSGDFGTTSGSFTITSNAGSFTVTPTADSTTEGSETFTVSIRTDSISGTVVATSNTVTINDTSLTSASLQVSLITAPSSGTTWTDASTNSRNATLYKSGTGDHSYTASNGGGITTTGSTTSNGAMIDIPYNLPSTFTIEIVASITSTNYWSTLFGNEAYSFNRGYFMYFGSPTLVDIGSSTGSEMYTLASGQKANRNHYVVTVTGTTLKFYLNGSLQTKTSGTFAQPSSGISTNSLQIGARHPNVGTIHTVNDPAHGTYYRVQVWDVVKTASEVSALYTAAATAHNL